MNCDHKAAKEWATNDIRPTPDGNLARCYLDLREKAKEYLDAQSGGDPLRALVLRADLRAILGE